MKKTISLFLAGTMLISTLVVGCSSTEKGKDEGNKKAEESSKKTIEFPLKEKAQLTMGSNKMAHVKPYNDLPFFKELEEKTNVNVNFLDWNAEKKNLAFASGDLPDALYGGWILNTEEIVNYGSQGLLIPLDNLIKDYAPNLSKVLEKRPDLKKMITAPDGHIYALPSYAEGDAVDTNDILIINKIWLDKVGKKIPTTTDEFYDVLKAIKNAGDLNGNGKDDEIPFTFRYGDHIKGINSFLGSFGLVDPQGHVTIRDKKTVFTPAQPEYKEGMKYLNKLFSEGLIDNESFTMNPSQITAKVRSKTPMIGATLEYTDTTPNATIGQDVYVAIPPLKGPAGHQSWARRYMPISSNFAYAITNKCKNPELYLAWADKQFEKEISIEGKSGKVGEFIEKKGEGKYVNKMDVNGKAFLPEVIGAKVPMGAGLYMLLKEDFQWDTVDRKKELDKMYEPYLQKDIYPAGVFLTKEENERTTLISTDISQYIIKMTAKWITAGGVDADWDGYLKELDKLGYQEYMKIMQVSYDRIK